MSFNQNCRARELNGMEQYPAVRFMVKHGGKFAILVGLALPSLVLIGALAAGWHE